MNRVKELRQDRCIQQKELAIVIGVSRPTVSEWEHGKKDPSGDRLKKLSEFFGVSPSVVLGANRDEPKMRAPTEEEIRYALFDGNESTQEDYDDVKRYAKYVIARRNGLIK